MTVQVREHEKFRAVYWVESGGETHLATKNLARGYSVYGEKLIEAGGEEYRLWSYYRSKLAAAIVRGISEIFIKPGSRVLYLGAATGTTASHVSDIIGSEGFLYGVDFSPRVMMQFLQNVAERRTNVAAIVGDARNPSSYKYLVGGVDVIYCDVAQPEQAKIVADNAREMLNEGGGVLVAIKARSIDSVEEPDRIFRRETEILAESGFKVLETISLEPYERDHVMVAARFRG
ncbi:MAG: fibrillarin-like rRNA/tRNA 2'-O-methyltransferase [Aigarchaeota archaeon]|nr:fibrillarin-like rRNA/tRNA 2'-O-methyltransferase [Candidatus Pelearchaeum maunauluense]